ncbi:hypothetical protein MNEG_3670 [Monoraphidium neglectum]|uniref:Glycoside-hydrolase family GH114 TIM-barrel domain-containing protein n=1 Tax=Monoraphidium neglectum TaxID=145388 RepID=A0A0D2LC05_9CHLO|nr:hypothetical protein MNEG_3670 [Monoraphidium neglectum]KIZ04284.1 hypothetical protein MNEG_3670 [Monoraphidium neglectum]|eukprot:XP_013903303.1 hypothetical protein MNEG_3670 [Monoraphidium neglectum]
MWVATASVYMIDLFLNSASTTAGIAAKGGFSVCRFNAGTYENWQPDSALFTAADHPASVWLDIRSLNVRSIMQKRLELCRAKGFVAVVPDGLDAYSNANGMGLTAADQISYNTFLANAAHSLGLSVGLMNDLNQIGDLLPSFDFFVNEECMKYSECNLYKPARLANMPVWQVEYGTSNKGTTFFQTVCKCQSTWGVKSIYKYTSLNTFRLECDPKYLAMACPYSARRLLSH